MADGLVWGWLILAAGAVGMSARFVEAAARHGATKMQ